MSYSYHRRLKFQREPFFIRIAYAAQAAWRRIKREAFAYFVEDFCEWSERRAKGCAK